MSLDTKKIKEEIIIEGAEMHNLKNINLKIPKKKLIVITGLSGSGKSSLAFDTIFAEGQRRFIESLSSYARQFLGKIKKPKVKKINGLSPAIAIEQKVNNSNPRSTVGTSSEIYDYLKLLYSRIGKTYSPVTNKEVIIDNLDTVIDYIGSFSEGDKFLVMVKLNCPENIELKKYLNLFLDEGYARIESDGVIYQIEDFNSTNKEKLYLVIDRSIYKNDKDYLDRITDSIENAFYQGNDEVYIKTLKDGCYRLFSKKFEQDGIKFIKPTEHLFSFNNPFGACSNCNGYGDIMGIDPELVIPDTGLSVYENCIAPWRGQKLSKYKDLLIKNSQKFNFPIHRPYFKLSKNEKKLIWEGNEYFKGINYFFAKLEKKMYKIQNRVMLSRYRGRTLCTVCGGTRLRKEANYVKINGLSISDLVQLPIDEVLDFFNKIELSETDLKKSNRIIVEIKNRLSFLCKVGLPYLTLNRKSNTLSGGETQRINIATSIGSALVGSIYVLDEPSVGLHPEDTTKLISILQNLRSIGNTVIIVEHDEDIIRSADQIIDLGPGAGTLGGEVVAQGSLNHIIKSKTITAKYLQNQNEIPIPSKRRISNRKIVLRGCRENNLKNINISIPLNSLVCVTGISGSGKTTLVKKILYPALLQSKGIYTTKPGQFSSISGNLDDISTIEFIDQNPIGQSSRSNPVTYIKAYDDIRNLFAKQSASKQFSFKPKHFSFNVDGGRCDDCKGEGTIKVEMQFMADINLICETCKGKRFKKNVLQVTYQNKNIDDILKMTIDEGHNFFHENGQNKIANKLKALIDVGMGYVNLGQSSSTLSGGEAQRIKLASFILKGRSAAKTLFIFDEPTTGLHFHDIKKLLNSFNHLISYGHSIIVVEHNIELIKSSDYIVDLGPYGGIKGGELIFEGSPEKLVKNKKSLLTKFLKTKLG